MRHMMKSDNSAEQTTYMLTQDNVRPQKTLPPHICVWENEGGQVHIGAIEPLLQRQKPQARILS